MGSLAEILKRRRSGARLSLSETARAAGLSKAHVWDMEDGRSINPSAGTLFRLGLALGCDNLELAAAALSDQEDSYKNGNGASK